EAAVSFEPTVHTGWPGSQFADVQYSGWWQRWRRNGFAVRDAIRRLCHVVARPGGAELENRRTGCAHFIRATSVGGLHHSPRWITRAGLGKSFDNQRKPGARLFRPARHHGCRAFSRIAPAVQRQRGSSGVAVSIEVLNYEKAHLDCRRYRRRATTYLY